MAFYEGDDRITDAVAQSCRHFNSKRAAARRQESITEGITCTSCKNSNGMKCMINAYDSVLTKIDS